MWLVKICQWHFVFLSRAIGGPYAQSYTMHMRVRMNCVWRVHRNSTRLYVEAHTRFIRTRIGATYAYVYACYTKMNIYMNFIYASKMSFILYTDKLCTLDIWLGTFLHTLCYMSFWEKCQGYRTRRMTEFDKHVAHAVNLVAHDWTFVVRHSTH